MDKNDAAEVASLAAIGLAAGLIGSAAMLLSQKAEMRVTGRESSQTPAEAVEKITRRPAPRDDAAQAELSTAAHFAFGTTLGLGLATMDRVPEPVRAGLFFAGAWSAGNGLVTGLRLADPPTRWSGRQLATDLGHHLVYAASAAAAYLGLKRLLRAAR